MINTSGVGWAGGSGGASCRPPVRGGSTRRVPLLWRPVVAGAPCLPAHARERERGRAMEKSLRRGAFSSAGDPLGGGKGWAPLLRVAPRTCQYCGRGKAGFALVAGFSPDVRDSGDDVPVGFDLTCPHRKARAATRTGLDGCFAALHVWRFVPLPSALPAEIAIACGLGLGQAPADRLVAAEHTCAGAGGRSLGPKRRAGNARARGAAALRRPWYGEAPAERLLTAAADLGRGSLAMGQAGAPCCLGDAPAAYELLAAERALQGVRRGTSLPQAQRAGA